MSPRESTIKAAIVRRVRASGRWCVRLGAGPYLSSGMPDILVHLKRPLGRAFYVEAKRPGEKPTKLQAAKIAEIRASGAAAIVAYSADEVMAAISEEEALPFYEAAADGGGDSIADQDFKRMVEDFDP